MRNRRYVMRKGPLVVFASDDGIGKAFRNLPGVEVTSVDALNLLQLAPGGHLGRFVIWSKAAFEKLDKIFGTTTAEAELKKGFTLPRAVMANGDLTRLINSDEIQSAVRLPKPAGPKHAPLKKNPLRNLGALLKLNPYAKVARRVETTRSTKKAAARAEKLEKLAKGIPTGAKTDKAAKAVGKAFYKQMVVESDYKGDDYDLFNRWIVSSKQTKAQ